MHGSNNIFLVGEVNDRMFLDFATQLTAFEAAAPAPVHVSLSSHGGESEAGLAIYGRMRASPNLIYVTAYGMCQSAATIILAGGDYRTSAVEVHFMVHDSPLPKKATDADRAKWERDEQQWAEILEQHSLLTSVEWRRLSKAETYLNPAQLLQFGVVDAIARSNKHVR